MTITQFRGLIVLYIVLLIAGGIASYFGTASISQELADAYAQQSNARIDEHLGTYVVALSILSIAIIAGMAGFFRLKRWGRTLSLYITIGSPLICLFSGPTLGAPLENMFFEAATLLWTALLTLAYCSPLNAQFGGKSLLEICIARPR